jgi:tetratricopeptide (TPR) repeat protein
MLILVFLTVTVYFRSLFLDYTRLDDSIFIIENAKYNSDPGNILVSFQRGLFNPTRDAYYRPVFLVDFILESRLFGTNPAGYHFTNLLFHVISVILLFVFLKKSEVAPRDALLLSAIFAVHPVLTQAVAWIPGRNDMLLMIFLMSSFLFLLRFLEKGDFLSLFLQTLFLILALFTKETAIIIPVIMAVFLIFIKKAPFRKMIIPGAAWIIAILLWFWVRSKATLASGWIEPEAMLSAGFSRLGVIIQYIGKIFLPVNLTVFPEYQDVSLIWGFMATLMFIALIIWSKSYRDPLTYLGLFWFLIFLVPVLIVPKSLNDQVFEHRLYLPVVGILMMLSRTWPFGGKAREGHLVLITGAIILIFSVQSVYRTGYFKNAITFWRAAVAGSPHSAYAHTLLGTKVEDPAEREALFRKAHSLDPSLKNLNYYLGKLMFDKKEVDSALVFLHKELEKNEIPDAWFLLAQISFEKNRPDSAAMCLEKVIALDPLNPQANHNLVLLYYQTGKKELARKCLDSMYEKGMTPGQDLVNMFKE